MKLIYFIFAILLFSGCTYFQHNIEITGTAPGIKYGVVIIKDASGKQAFDANIQDEKFQVHKQLFKYPGYYTMDVTNYDKKNSDPLRYELYLDKVSYAIEIRPEKYPAVTTSSKQQQDLAAYFTISDSIDQINHHMHHEEDSLQNILNDKKSVMLPPPAYLALVEKLKKAQNKKIAGISTADKIAAFIKKYPQNQIAAHLINEQDYTTDPVAFYTVYQSLSPEQKNTEDGQQAGTALIHLVKLVPGAVAPAITGNLPDGTPFDIKTIHKKVIIIDFWRSGDQIGRENHTNISANLMSQINGKDKVGVVSFSFDTKRDHWLDAIKADKMDWPQVSDLKGDDSPNTIDWGIKTMPTYYVISGDGKIIEGDVTFSRLSFVINNYLDTHH